MGRDLARRVLGFASQPAIALLGELGVSVSELGWASTMAWVLLMFDVVRVGMKEARCVFYSERWNFGI